MVESQESPEDISRQKWWRLPSALTVDLAQVRSLNTYKLVIFIARQTFGWGVRSAIMSYDELRHGRYYAPGKRMKDISGLRNDQAIADAIRDASLERGLIEVQQTTAGAAYRIPDRYWNEAGLVPEHGEFWRYTPRWVSYTNGSAQENRADAAADNGNTNGSAQHFLAQQQENLSTTMGIPEHSNKKNLAQPLHERAPQVAPSVPLDTSLDTSLDTFDRYVGPSAALQAPMSLSKSKRVAEPTNAGAPTKKAAGKRSADDTGTQDIDALAQHLADQQVLQSLLAERQSLQHLSPGQRGWGAAQRRLRAIAPEIARLQAVCAAQATELSSNETEALSSEPETSDSRKSAKANQPIPLMSAPTQPASEDPAEIAARRQRLLALQQELAQLTRTPSMQLLARQRIPRLEEAIKRLIAEMQESA